MNELLVVVPAYGQHNLTHTLVGDLEREKADYLIVDNGGDYPAIGGERVIKPAENLRWAGGSELGFRFAFAQGYQRAMTVNNDTRISQGFVDAFLDPRLPADAGIVGPMLINGCFPHAESPVSDLVDYVRRPRCRKTLAVEGTALMITRACWDTVGGLDVANFGQHGWGADVDLAARARNAGFGVYTTEMACVHHFGRRTAYTVAAPDASCEAAWAEMQEGMYRKYGPAWHALTPAWRVNSDTGSMDIAVYVVLDLTSSAC